jgi:hypothetical protein
VNSEPLYEFVKGEGWVANPEPFPCIDVRKDKNQPGVYRTQIWLVGVPGFTYKDWVDRAVDRKTYSSEDAARKSFDNIYNNKSLKNQGMKCRILWVDKNGQWDEYPWI